MRFSCVSPEPFTILIGAGLDARVRQVIHDRARALGERPRHAVQLAAERLVDRLGDEVVRRLVGETADVGQRRRDVLGEHRWRRRRLPPRTRPVSSTPKSPNARVQHRRRQQRAVGEPAQVDVVVAIVGDATAHRDDELVVLAIGVDAQPRLLGAAPSRLILDRRSSSTRGSTLTMAGCPTSPGRTRTRVGVAIEDERALAVAGDRPACARARGSADRRRDRPRCAARRAPPARARSRPRRSSSATDRRCRAAPRRRARHRRRRARARRARCDSGSRRRDTTSPPPS